MADPTSTVPLSDAAPASKSNSRRKFFIAPTDLLLFAAVLVAYLPSLSGTRLWDDNAHLIPPSYASFHGLVTMWRHPMATQQYYPFLYTAFWVENRIWGDLYLGYHLVNVFLHAFSACLAIRLMRRLAVPGALLAAFLIALHPVFTESVAWMSEQKNTLSGVLYLSSMLMYLRFDRDRERSRYWWATGLFVLALLSKTVTATLPCALLVIFWWKRAKLEWRRDVRPLLPWIALSIPAGLLTSWLERASVGAQGAEFLLTPLQRCLLAGRVICFYAAKIVWPVDLLFNYPHWTIDPHQWTWYLYSACVLIALSALLILARWRRGPLAAALLFVGTLTPVLGFFDVYPFRYSYVADHFQYLPAMILIVAFSAGLTMLTGQFPARRFGIAAAGIGVMAAGTMTWRQAHLYSDAETLYRETLARNPDSYLARNNLCNLLLDNPDRVTEAVGFCQESAGLWPNSPEARLNYGLVLRKMEQWNEAISEYEAAIRLNPKKLDAHVDLAEVYVHMPGRLDDARRELEIAVSLAPTNATMHISLGNVLLLIPGKALDAAVQYNAAIKIDRGSAQAHFGLGKALLQIDGKHAEALSELEKALELAPDSPEVLAALAEAK